MKPPPATGAHGEDKALSSAGHSPRPGDGQCPQAPGSPGVRRAAPGSPALTDGERGASGLGSCCTIEPGYRPGRAAPLPPASLPLIPFGLTSLPPCFPRQGSGFQERLLLSRWAGCSPPLLPLPWIPFSSGIRSSPPLLPALRPAKSLSPLCGSRCLGLLAFCAASDCT